MVAATVVAALTAIAGAYDSKRSGEKAKRKESNIKPIVDTEAQRAAAQRRALAAQSGVAGGLPGTFQTGPGGIAPPAMNGKGAKSLLGQ